jgi:pyridoxamine 5'-phosphate oxidase family protein
VAARRAPDSGGDTARDASDLEKSTRAAAAQVTSGLWTPGRKDIDMSFDGFSADERAWLASQRLGRLATVSGDGIVGNAPVTYFLRADDTIDIGGMRMGATKKFKNVAAGSRVAFVVDTVDTSTGWTPHYLEIRGRAEALSDVQPPADGFSREIIRIHPDWSKSFNLPPAGA